MSEKKSVFKGDATDLDSVNLEEPLQTVKSSVCDYYTSAYAEEAKKAEDSGDTKTARVFQFIQVVTSFHPDFGDPVTPYRPMLVMDGRRSLVPDDLHENDFSVIRELAVRVIDPALRARLYDVLWIEERNHLDCREASASYLKSAKHLDANDDWTFAVTQYFRGLQLASKLGRRKDSFQTISTELVAAIVRTRDSEDEYRTSRFLDVAI